MNMNNIILILKKNFKSLSNNIHEHSPEILTGVGIGGMIITVVMAVRSTPKALILIENRKEETSQSKLTPAETIKVTWKCYIPPLVVGTMSTACLIGATSINLRRKSALATAYALSESAMREYQEKVIKTIGEKKEQDIKDAIAKDKVEKNPPVSSEVVVTGAGQTLFYDATSDRYFMCNIEKIRRIENTLNYKLRQEMYFSMNDLYYELGLKPTPIGDDLGWNVDNGEMRIEFSAQLIMDENSIYYGQPCIVLNFDHYEPRYDYRRLI